MFFAEPRYISTDKLDNFFATGLRACFNPFGPFRRFLNDSCSFRPTLGFPLGTDSILIAAQSFNVFHILSAGRFRSQKDAI